jgi:uncharacterized protein YbjQ (UPF0145 family)
MAKLIRFPSLIVIAMLSLGGLAIAAETCGRPTLADSLAPQVVLADPPPPPRDATMEAIELELASRLVGVAPGEAHEVAKTLVDEARKEAVERLMEHAKSLGANAVLGVRFDSSDMGNGLAEILAYGTAVKVSPTS